MATNETNKFSEGYLAAMQEVFILCVYPNATLEEVKEYAAKQIVREQS